jgi:hypothetical protein
LQKEFLQGLQQFDAILQRWRIDQQDNREVYHYLYKSVPDFDFEELQRNKGDK